jgi:hypothetical protein
VFVVAWEASTYSGANGLSGRFELPDKWKLKIASKATVILPASKILFFIIIQE